jgi:hypothetical protein
MSMAAVLFKFSASEPTGQGLFRGRARCSGPRTLPVFPLLPLGSSLAARRRISACGMIAACCSPLRFHSHNPHPLCATRAVSDLEHVAGLLAISIAPTSARSRIRRPCKNCPPRTAAAAANSRSVGHRDAINIIHRYHCCKTAKTCCRHRRGGKGYGYRCTRRRDQLHVIHSQECADKNTSQLLSSPARVEPGARNATDCTTVVIYPEALEFWADRLFDIEYT